MRLEREHVKPDVLRGGHDELAVLQVQNVHDLADSIRKNDGRESLTRFVGRVDGDGFRDNRNGLAVEGMGSRGGAALIMGLAS